MTAPKLSVGVMIPNPTFGVPNSTGTGAAGWGASGAGLTQTPIRDTRTGRRGQRYSRSTSGSNTVLSDYSPPYRCTAPASTYFWAAVDWRSASNASGDTWTLSAVQYDASENVLATTTLLTDTGASANSTWELATGTVNITPNASTVWWGLQLSLTSNGAASWDFCFAGFGTSADGTTPGYFAPSSDSEHPGTFAELLFEGGLGQTLRGVRMATDADRTPEPFRVGVAHYNLSDTDKSGYHRIWSANRNALWVPSSANAANPGGGAHPVLLIPGLGDPDAPAAMYCDMEGMFPFRPWDREWLPEDWIYQGQALFRERVVR